MKKQNIIVDVICFLVALLFLYAAISKLIVYDVYLRDLRRSPYLTYFVYPLAIFIPAAEIIISALFIGERTRNTGLIGAFILMILFTGYVALVLGASEHLPCTCGGLIKQLSWQNHLILNISYTALIGVGIWLNYKSRKYARVAR